MLSEYEAKLFDLVKTTELNNSLSAVKEAVDTIWSEEVRIIRDYTDHGCKHSERIFKKLFEVLLEKQHNITEEELYVLILGIYLHDIGMQCDIKKHIDIKEVAINKFNAVFMIDFMPSTANSYSTAEQNEIRKNHHLLTAAWLDYAYNNTGNILSDALRKVNVIYIEDLISICMFHSKLNIMDCQEKTDVNKVRRRFVAALLRFGDELDIDQYRVNTETVKEFGYETDNSVYWYLHGRTQIKIDKNEVIITVSLNPYDYALCHSAINNLVISEFKQKNKILTDILTKNEIPIFISENSKVISHEYTKRLPDEELKFIINLGKNKIEKENEENLQLINKINEKINKNEDIMPVIAGELMQNEFAKNHIKYVELEANNLFQMIQQLKNKYLISKNDLEKTKTAFNKIIGIDSEQVHKYTEEIAVGFKAFLFIQAFSTQQMTFLYDLGQSLHGQVMSGQALEYAREFFTFYYNKFLKYPNASIKMNERFDYYTFEQIGRILIDYESIVRFDYNKIKFSKGYLYEKESCGELLAVSVEGESNKIFVWDVSSRLYEPIAALGGLYETVSEVKVIRSNSNVMIAAKGNRQIYLWNITNGNGMPAFIFRSSESIYHYAVVRSMNGELHILGVSRENIYIWKIGDDEKPFKIYNNSTESEDILIVDTKLEKDHPSYALIGDRSFDSINDSDILELKEVLPLKYTTVRLISKKGILGDDYINKMDNYSVECYQITAKSKIMGVLFRDYLVLYDLNNKKKLVTIPRKGQQILGFKMIEVESIIYVLTYHLYFKQLDNEEGLVRCYTIRDGELIEEKEWFSGKRDMKKAVIANKGNDFCIFFNQYHNNIIYRTEYESDNYEEFYKLPNSMNLNDMVNG